MGDRRDIPRWTRALLRFLAPRGQADNVVGDLEETHRLHAQRHGSLQAKVRTGLDTLDMAAALVRIRMDLFGIYKGSGTLQDYKLGLRMLVKFPGLTIAGGLALALAIGVGAGWYDFTGDMWRPRLPFPGGDRLVEVEMRNAAGGGDERRIMHDFGGWRRDARTIADLSAYRTVERNVSAGGGGPETVIAAETTASLFRVVQVPVVAGRPLLDADEQPGATPVVVIGYDLWRRWFNQRPDAIGSTVEIGRTPTTIVGVMPEGFSFPRNHRLWLPLQLRSAGYAPLEGPGIRVFGRLAPGSDQAEANVELKTLTEYVKSTSPQTHQHLSPRVLAYGGESPGDRAMLELLVSYLPIVLVLLVACSNVGTLIYARTATRDAEITMRYALGATRGRIVTQLFVEALVLASLAAVVGLVAANWALKAGVAALYSGEATGVPFWLHPGLKLKTMAFAMVLTVVGAALLSLLPALKATGRNAQTQLRNLGAGGSSLRFGKVWTGVMIAQVAITVILIPPSIGASEESWRDREIRSKFPAERYLAVQVDTDTARRNAEESASDFAARFARTYRELERRIAQQPEVTGVFFGDRLPGMDIAVSGVDIETSPGALPVFEDTVWLAAVGPGYFEAFDVPVVAGRGFHDGDRGPDVHSVLVNENFARLHFNGANPIGRRVRFASASTRGPWLEIVGMVRDVGMQPTDRGEAPHIYTAATLTNARPLVIGIRVTGDADTLAPRVRAMAAEIDPDLRLTDVRSLDDLAWREDLPGIIASGGIVSVVGLSLFLSAAGIFSLMSVSVARRTREIGIRAALGASPGRVLTDIFKRAFFLIGGGVAAGNAVLLLFVALSDEVSIGFVANALMGTSAIVLTAGLLACVEPARRALRIHPTDALREV